MKKRQLVVLAFVLGSILIVTLIGIAIFGTALVLRPTVQLPAQTQAVVPTQPPIVIPPTAVIPIPTAIVPPASATPIPQLPTATLPAPAAPTPITTAPGFFADPQAFRLAIFLPCPADASTCIPLDVSEIHSCPQEPYGTCWTVTREKDLYAVIHPFMGQNPMSCGFDPNVAMQDGYMDDVQLRTSLGRQSPPWPAPSKGSGVPDGFVGLMQGLTIRPCDRAPKVP